MNTLTTTKPPSMTTGSELEPLALPPATAPMQMLQLAIDKGATIDVLTKLMDLQERMEATQARREYDAAMADVKARVGTVRKTGIGHNRMAYATMADIAGALDPVVAEHGLSYRFRSQRVGNELVVTCVVCHRAGHYEENSLPSPLDTSGSKNPVQAVGSTCTYLQRYTLIQAFGLSASVEGNDISDDDGQGAGKATVKNGWPQGSIHEPGDYVGNGTRAKDTEPKQPRQYTRTLNAALTHTDRARAMQDELRQCETVPELDACAIDMEKRQDYKNLPQMLKNNIAQTYAECLTRLQTAVVHDSDDMEPRKARSDDLVDPPPPEEGSISQRAIAARTQPKRPPTPEEIANYLKA